MTGDAIFVQGHGHTICQDYAIATDYGAAIVCDGCSASPKSEVGAAILAHTFLESYRDTRYGHLKDQPETDKIFDIILKTQVFNRVKEIMRHTGLPDNAFDATIVAAIADPDKDILRLFMWGDGYIFIDSNEGETLYTGNYESGAPKYFSYSLDDEREGMYKSAFGDKPRTITTKCFLPSGVETTMVGDLPDYHCWTIPLAGITMVQAFSDGLASFLDGQNKAVLVRDILPSVAKFKLSHGSFVQRRVRRALKDFQKQGVTHYDDFSSAAISFEDLTLARGK